MKKADKLYHAGLMELSPSRVRRALAEGADVNCRYEGSDAHPVQEFLTYHNSLFDDDEALETPVAERRKYLQIVDMLIASRPDLTSASPVTGLVPLDDIISATECLPEQVDIAARAVIMTLKKNVEEGRPPYAPDYDSLFTEVRGGARHAALDSIEAVHQAVRGQLTAPETRDAKFLAARPGQLGFWGAPFDRPDTGNLPQPAGADKERMHAVMQSLSEGMGADGKHSKGLTSRFDNIKSRNTLHARTERALNDLMEKQPDPGAAGGRKNKLDLN